MAARTILKDKVSDFSEWRHAHGMRCLGIPNTKDQFFFISTSTLDYTKIGDTHAPRNRTAGWDQSLVILYSIAVR